MYTKGTKGTIWIKTTILVNTWTRSARRPASSVDFVNIAFVWATAWIDNWRIDFILIKLYDEFLYISYFMILRLSSTFFRTIPRSRDASIFSFYCTTIEEKTTFSFHPVMPKLAFRVFLAQLGAFFPFKRSDTTFWFNWIIGTMISIPCTILFL